MTTVQELAAEMNAAFTVDTRADGEHYHKLRDGSPEWMTDVIREAHDGMLPDDWRYKAVAEIVEQLAEGADEDDVMFELEADVYDADLYAWLQSHAYRKGYVDSAVEQYGHSELGVTGDIGLGQIVEKQEILGILVRELTERVEELELAECLYCENEAVTDDGLCASCHAEKNEEEAATRGAP